MTDGLAPDLEAHRQWRMTGGAQGARFVLRGRPTSADNLARSDLEDADLTGLSLPGSHLEGVRWAAASLAGADLRGARLTGDLRQADLRGADLRETVLEGADLRGADLRGADLRGADLFCCYLDEADLRDTLLEGTSAGAAIFEATMRDLQNRALSTGGVTWFLEAVRVGELEVSPLSADGQGAAAVLLRALPRGLTPAQHPLPALVEYWLTPIPPPTWAGLLVDHAQWVASRGREGQRLSTPQADLRGRDLRNTNLRGAGLVRVRLQGADLRGVCLDDALLLEGDFTGANLREFSMQRAHLRGARLAGVQLAADARGADLREVDLQFAVVSALRLEGARLGGTELREADWQAVEQAWQTVVASAPSAARDVLRALQGGVPSGGLSSHLVALGMGELPPSILGLTSALRPGDMAMSHPVARLLSEWTLRFIGAGGAAGRKPGTERTPLDPEQVAVRIDAHRRWRSGKGGERLVLAGDLGYGLDFSGADLREADLSGADLRGSVFDDADLRDTDLRSADLRDCRFEGARLAGARLDGVRLMGAWLAGLDLAGAHIEGASFARALLTDARFQGAHFTEVSFAGALLAQADLRGAVFVGCDWRGAALAGARMEGAQLTGPFVFGPALVQADLGPIEAAFEAVTALPELARALAAALREPPPRRRLSHLLLGHDLPVEAADRVRAWLGALGGEEGAEVDMAVDQTLVWLGVPAPSLESEVDHHHGHHHH